MSKFRGRLLAVTGSSLIGLLVAGYVWNHRPSPETVVLVDNRAQVEALLERSASAESTVSARESALLAEELLRKPIAFEDAKSLFASLRADPSREKFDPQCYTWAVSHQDRSFRFEEYPGAEIEVKTNDMGFRKSVDVLTEAPDLRVLVTGDSHTAGVVPNHEQFPNVLERQLSDLAPELTIECLNGGKGAFDFYHYVGVLEKFLHLEPDVFVVAVYGGNDFKGGVQCFRFFNELGPQRSTDKAKRKLKSQLPKLNRGFASQDMLQVIHFWLHPEAIEVADAIARQALTTIQRICDENDIEFMLVYIPPCREVSPDTLRPWTDMVTKALEFTPEDLEVTGGLAQRMMGLATERQIDLLDMGPIFAEQEELCYWRSDLHINTLGHRLIAEGLRDRLAKTSLGSARR